MNEFDIDKSYESIYDEFLTQFDQEHELSESQRKEINKHKRLQALRDGTEVAIPLDKIWENF